MRSVTVNKTCILCHENAMSFILDANKYERWQSGELIQNVFPELSVNEREMLISSICGSCYDDLLD